MGCSFDFLLVVVVVVVAVAVAVVVGGGGWLCFLLCIVGLVGKDPRTVGDPYMVARSTFSGIPAQVVLVLYIYVLDQCKYWCRTKRPPQGALGYYHWQRGTTEWYFHIYI